MLHVTRGLFAIKKNPLDIHKRAGNDVESGEITRDVHVGKRNEAEVERGRVFDLLTSISILIHFIQRTNY